MVGLEKESAYVFTFVLVALKLFVIVCALVLDRQKAEGAYVST